MINNDDQELQKRREAVQKLKSGKNKELELSAKITELTEKNTELSSEIETLKNDLKAERDKNKVLETKSQEKEADIARLQIELQQNRSENADLTKNIEEITTKLESSKNELNRAKEEHQSLEQRLQASELSNNSLKQEIERGRVDFKELADKYEKLKREHEALKISHTKLQNDYESLENSNNVLQRDNLKRINELEQENKGKLKVEIDRLSAEKERLQKDFAAKEKEYKEANLNFKQQLENAAKALARHKEALQQMRETMKERDVLYISVDETLNSTLNVWEDQIIALVEKLGRNNLLQSNPSANILKTNNKSKIEQRTKALKEYIGQIALQSQEALAIPFVSQILEALNWKKLADVLDTKNYQKLMPDILARLGLLVELVPASKGPSDQGKVLLMQLKNNASLYLVCFSIKNSENESPLYIYVHSEDNSVTDSQFISGIVTRVEEDKGEIREYLGRSAPTNRKIFKVSLSQIEQLNINLSLKAERKNLHVQANAGYKGTMNQAEQKIVLNSRPQPVIQQPVQQIAAPKKKINIISEGFLKS